MALAILVPAGKSQIDGKRRAFVVQRTIWTDSNVAGKFWACPRFPRCRNMLPMWGSILGHIQSVTFNLLAP
jgi:hypothetical protein